MTKLFGILLLLAVFTVSAGAQDAKKTKPAAKKIEAVAAGNTVCPVTGEAVDPKVSYTYKGKIYNFCCEGCVAKFKKTPVKYIKAMETKKFDACTDKKTEATKMEPKKAELKASAVSSAMKGVINTGKDMSAQISNTICPVMKKAVDKSVTTVTYNNKVYGFCCAGCIKKFAMDPEKYLKSAN